MRSRRISSCCAITCAGASDCCLSGKWGGPRIIARHSPKKTASLCTANPSIESPACLQNQTTQSVSRLCSRHNEFQASAAGHGVFGRPPTAAGVARDETCSFRCDGKQHALWQHAHVKRRQPAKSERQSALPTTAPGSSQLYHRHHDSRKDVVSQRVVQRSNSRHALLTSASRSLVSSNSRACCRHMQGKSRPSVPPGHGKVQIRRLQAAHFCSVKTPKHFDSCEHMSFRSRTKSRRRAGKKRLKRRGT